MRFLATASVVVILSMFASTLLAGPMLRDAGPFSEMVVFGDSFSDVGNVYTATGGVDPPSPPYYEGRYSNGPVWVEYLAPTVGLTEPTASRDGGLNYAHGYAETGSGVSTVMGVPNVGTQIEGYLSGGGTFDANQLIVLTGGGGDLVYGGKTDPIVMANNLLAHVDTIVAEGGKSFVMLTMPFTEEMAPVFVPFNGLVTAGLVERMATDGITVYRPDVMQLYGMIAAEPATFGFVNVSDPAFNQETGEVVDNPDEYVLWDPLHFTTRTQSLLAEWAADTRAIPEPSSCLLLLTGIVGLATAVLWHRKNAE